MRPAVARLVLHRLVGQVALGLALVPGGDGPAAGRAPSRGSPRRYAAKWSRCVPVRADARQRRERRLRVRRRRRRRPPAPARRGPGRSSARGRTLTPRRSARPRARRRPRCSAAPPSAFSAVSFCSRGVVGAALAAEDQEAVEPRPVVDRPGVAAGAVRHLVRARDRLRAAACGSCQIPSAGRSLSHLLVRRRRAKVVRRRLTRRHPRSYSAARRGDSGRTRTSRPSGPDNPHLSAQCLGKVSAKDIPCCQGPTLNRLSYAVRLWIATWPDKDAGSGRVRTSNPRGAR